MSIESRDELSKSAFGASSEGLSFSSGTPRTWVGANSVAMVRLVESWERGDPIPVAELIAGMTRIDSSTAVELIYEEMHLKRDAGIEVRTSEVVRQFPEYSEPLRAVMQFDRLLDAAGARRRFPNPGERLGPFELLNVLGEGASGRTYVALESSLADRPVVLKVMPLEHVEHLNLARLQHTHIMPLYSEMVLQEQGLRILVMPWLGGFGLDRILKRLADRDCSRRSGRDILDMIDGFAVEEANRMPGQGTSRSFFEQASYADAIAHIGLCLAEAAAEAHARGLVHMDIKPSNVLISADARPVLLDFHLARAPVLEGDRAVEWLGGTPGWTSPEQNACFQAAAAGQPMPCDIDGRSDIHAIGTILARALGVRDSKPGDLVRFDSDVSPGLGDIIRRCIFSDPGKRYATASELAEDLRRHLANEPLLGVSNRSLSERFRKWRKRNPTGFVWSVVALLGFTTSAIVLRQVDAARQKATDNIRSTIEDALRLERAGLFDEAMDRLRRVLEETSTLPGLHPARNAIQWTEFRIKQSRRLADLGRATEMIRMRFGTRHLPEESLSLLETRCRDLWENRELLAKAAESSADEGQAEAEITRVRRQLLEIAVTLVELTLRENDEASRRKAETILAEAESSLGSHFALALARASIDSRAGARQRDVSLPPSIEPASAWDHDQLGRFHMRNGRTEEAALAFEKAIELEPDEFWYHFDLAICLYRRSEWSRSLTAWSCAVALRPDSAVCRYNRALAFEAIGQFDNALNDYNAAIRLDPELSLAAIRTAMLLQKRGEEMEALRLLNRAAGNASDDRTRAMAWARIVATHAEAGRTEEARKALRQAATLGLVVDDPDLIHPGP